MLEISEEKIIKDYVSEEPGCVVKLRTANKIGNSQKRSASLPMKIIKLEPRESNSMISDTEENHFF